MRKLIVYRRRQFASALVPYWIVTGISKFEFMETYTLLDDTSCQLDKWFRPIARMQFNPQEYGARIFSGEKIELEVEETIKSVFAITYAGLLSNELFLDPSSAVHKILVTSKDGWKHPSYPKLTLAVKNEPS